MAAMRGHRVVDSKASQACVQVWPGCRDWIYDAVLQSRPPTSMKEETMTHSLLRRLVPALGLALGLNIVAAHAEPNAQVYEKAEQDKGDALALLQRLVGIDSGTFNEQGINQVGAIATAELTALGARIETFPATPALSRNIVATLTGTGHGRILLVAHMDTVFADGAAAERPFHIDAGRAYGPGVMDDKGGIVAAVYALKILKQINFRNYGKITLLLNTNEETGSLGSRALIERLSRDNDVAFNLEPGRPADGLVISRKGSGQIELTVEGKAAHAGVAPELGRNAAMEAAHQMLQLSVLGNEAKHTTVNFTVVKAGERSNVIPDHATLVADVRVTVPEEFDRVERDLRRIVAHQLIPDAKVTATLVRDFPPIPQSPAIDALAAHAQTIYGELGRQLTLESSGGAADASLMAGVGTPVIDGLGLVGGFAHSPQEYAEVGSVAPVPAGAPADGIRPRKINSAAAIGRIRPRRHHQRHMVILVRAGDAEGQRDQVDEARLRQHHALRREIIAGVEHQLIQARLHRFAFQQRRGAAAVGVGDVHLQQHLAFRPVREQRHLDAGARLAVGDIEYVRA